MCSSTLRNGFLERYSFIVKIFVCIFEVLPLLYVLDCVIRRKSKASCLAKLACVYSSQGKSCSVKREIRDDQIATRWVYISV